jgi:2-haloacid dehalogenase
MRYSTLLFDLDHTLLDSTACEAAAFVVTLAGVGVDEPLRHLDTYSEINLSLWAAVERGALTPQDVRVTRFERLVTAIELDADPESLADTFAYGLGANSQLGASAIKCWRAVPNSRGW